MKIRWLRTALRNLADEADYIAAEDGAAARLVVKRVLEAVELLSTQPAIGRPGRVHGTRELLVPKTRYLIPYRIHRDQVQVLRVFHTSRKPPKRW